MSDSFVPPPPPPGAATPPPPPSPLNPTDGNSSVLSIITLVSGILTLVLFWCCWMGFLGVIPVILGFIELHKIKEGTSSPSGKIMAILGLSFGALAFILTIVILFLGIGLNLMNSMNSK